MIKSPTTGSLPLTSIAVEARNAVKAFGQGDAAVLLHTLERAARALKVHTEPALWDARRMIWSLEVK